MTERKLLPRWALVVLAAATAVVVYNAARADSWDDRVILIGCAAVLAVFVAMQAVRHARDADRRTGT